MTYLDTNTYYKLHTTGQVQETEWYLHAGLLHAGNCQGNIDTFIDGLKNAERKPTSKTPFVATITDKDGNKTRRTLTTVSYQSSNEEELKINDAILHEAGTSVRFFMLWFYTLFLVRT